MGIREMYLQVLGRGARRWMSHGEVMPARAGSTRGKTKIGRATGRAATVSRDQNQERHRQSRPGSDEATIQSMYCISRFLGGTAVTGHENGEVRRGPWSSCMMQGTGPAKKLSDVGSVGVGEWRVTLCGSG
jgi:hypothetical protein